MNPQGPGQPPLGAGPQPGAPPPQAMPPDPTTPPDQDQDPDSDNGQCQTTQQIAGYMGPENGPFECGNCTHFQGPSSCDLVAGKIDEDGCCNLFTPGGNDPDSDDNNDQQQEEPGYPDVASALKGQ